MIVQGKLEDERPVTIRIVGHDRVTGGFFGFLPRVGEVVILPDAEDPMVVQSVVYNPTEIKTGESKGNHLMEPVVWLRSATPQEKTNLSRLGPA